MRKLKILHLGNIANNAYLNAKLLRERGHECHVACPDFYHFAGCSEWIDIAVPVDRGAFGDPNFPNFWCLGSSKPEIPRWFAQGPENSVLNYLFFLNKNNEKMTEVAWNVLQYHKFKVIYKKNNLAHNEIWNKALLDVAFDEMKLSHVIAPDIAGGLLSDTARYLVYEWNRKVAVNAASFSMPTFPMPGNLLQGYAVYDPPLRALLDADIYGSYLAAIGLQRREADITLDTPDRSKLHVGSERYTTYIDLWRELFGFYDLVMAYGPSPIIPYLAGIPHYVAYEHGTLRDLPFDGSVQGELITASYEHAKAVFVTNNDYLDQDRQLNIEPGRLHSLPHAFDERPLREYMGRSPVRLPETVTFFAPARQDWVKQFPSMTKNNHFVVHAARALVDLGYNRFRVIFVEWGDDVAATKELIAELGLEDIFEWTPPLAKQQLWTAYASAHAVIDQFLLDSISGVSFEALALGRRVITRDNGVSNLRAFGEQPPLLAAHDIQSVIVAMRKVLDDPADTLGIGAAAWRWTDRCHSAKRIADLQEGVFAAL